VDVVIQDDDDVAIAAISVAELLVGVELAGGKTRKVRSELLKEILRVVPIVDYDLAVARAHAQLLFAVRQQGRPRGAHDLIIAATALSSNRSVITADRAAFNELPGVVPVFYR
jgi:tRNA(fMet)-specific endonuclease VapC